MMPWQLYELQPTNHIAVYLKRYSTPRYLEDADGNPIVKDGDNKVQYLEGEIQRCTCSAGENTYHGLEVQVPFEYEGKLLYEDSHSSSAPPDSSSLHTQFALDDPQWPKACACGYQFLPGDGFQVIERRVYTSEKHPGQLFTADNAPWGAVMWGGEWALSLVSRQYKEKHAAHRKPFLVKLPSRWKREYWFSPDWQTSRLDGEGWEVSGGLLDFTVSPSINIIGDYHGWIQNGVITDDCEGRVY